MKIKFSQISFIIALISLFLAYQANQIAERAVETAERSNILAKEANEISKEGNLFIKTSTDLEFLKSSTLIVDEAYDAIYMNESLKRVVNNLSQNKRADTDDLGEVIDIFENLGSKYCKGLVDKEQLRASFHNTLVFACNNKQVYDMFKNRKNGTALLCYQLVPGSQFAETFKKGTINTCRLQ